MKLRGIGIGLLALTTIFGLSFSVFATMTSTNYEIQWDEINAGGGEGSSSASYQLRDSVSSAAATRSDGTNYDLDSGYRAGIYDRVADFEIFLQDRSSQVSATIVTSTVVTVTSTSSFSTGQMIALVQSEGDGQIDATGKILSINSGLSQITVDAWNYGSGGMPSVDGNNDYVYELDASSVSFGTISDLTVTTSIIAWEVSAEVSDGYSVYVYENQDLTNGIDTITDVSDGTVSAGSREYGARSSDSSLALSTFDTQDSAFTTALQQIGSRSAVSFDSRDYLTVKTSIDGFESDGLYSQTLTFIYVGDY
ncbi:hypothetical protein A2317_03660 [Candidatus Uhrbacteria bacterium RIFOXYB2_FULL_41_10]|nr:MAG: hypothetical protein A2317_03660 [Candidatus Uhrbacteria bacterium RIFOXYB2_FULL_41_10]